MTKPAIYEGYPDPHKVTGHNNPSPEKASLADVVGCHKSAVDDWTGVCGTGNGATYFTPQVWNSVNGKVKTHRIWLRSNFEVVFNLPEDVTASELNRLCSFLDLLVEPQ